MGADTLLTVLTLLTGQIDAANIIAHANMVRSQTGVNFTNAAALALAWQETRSGRSKNTARGQEIWASKTTGKHCKSVVCVPGDSVRICREIGRMQLSPCNNYTKLDTRCTIQAIKDSIDVNIHCGLLFFVEKIKFCNGDIVCAIERYNGHGCIQVSKHTRRCSHQYIKEAATYIGLLYLHGWKESN